MLILVRVLEVPVLLIRDVSLAVIFKSLYSNITAGATEIYLLLLGGWPFRNVSRARFIALVIRRRW